MVRGPKMGGGPDGGGTRSHRHWRQRVAALPVPARRLVVRPEEGYRDMETIRTTVPGVGVVHHVTTRDGQRFGVLAEGGTRRLLTFDGADPDTPSQTIVLTQGEADVLAEILHSRPVTDRLAELERKVAAVAGER